MLQARGTEELGAMRGLAVRSPDEVSRGLRSEPQEEFDLDLDPAGGESEAGDRPEDGAWWLSDAKRGFDEDEEDEDDKKDEEDDLDDDEAEVAEEEAEEEGFDDDDDDDEDDLDLDDDDDDE